MKLLVPLLSILACSHAHLRGEDALFPRQDQSMNPDNLKQHILQGDPNLEFELVKRGIDPSSPNDLINVENFSGEVALDSSKDSAVDREMILNLCTTIENLFSGTVLCACNPQIAMGIVGFDCEYMADIEIGPLIYTPSYSGVFTFRLFRMTYTFGGSWCANDLAVLTEQYGFLNFGDFCVEIEFTVGLNQETRRFEAGLSSCSVAGGTFITCESCEPCTNDNGQQGLALTCSNAQVAACLPIRLPFSPLSPEVSGEDMFDDIDVSEAIDMAIEQRTTEIAAVEAANEPDESDNDVEPDDSEDDPDDPESEDEPDADCKKKGKKKNPADCPDSSDDASAEDDTESVDEDNDSGISEEDQRSSEDDSSEDDDKNTSPPPKKTSWWKRVVDFII